MRAPAMDQRRLGGGEVATSLGPLIAMTSEKCGVIGVSNEGGGVATPPAYEPDCQWLLDSRLELHVEGVGVAGKKWLPLFLVVLQRNLQKRAVGAHVAVEV
jgi:hypothetical protein